MGHHIALTPSVTWVPANKTAQPLEQAIDVSCYDELVLQASLRNIDTKTYGLVQILTSMDNTSTASWQIAATFRFIEDKSDVRWQVRRVRRLLKYVRWQVDVFAAANIQIEGMARKRTRASFEPVDLPDLRLWSTAEQIAESGLGSPVDLWRDEGPDGNDFFVGKGGGSPLLEADQLNGLPGVKFNGTTDFLESAVGPSLGDFTAFVVFRWAGGSPANGERLLDKNRTNGFWTGRNATTASSWGGGVLETTAPFGGFGTFTDGNSHVLVLTRSGTTRTVYRGATQVASGTVASTFTQTETFILAAAFNGTSYDSFSQVLVFEVIVYSAALSDTNREMVLDYLNRKWGV